MPAAASEKQCLRAPFHQNSGESCYRDSLEGYPNNYAKSPWTTLPPLIVARSSRPS
jgi:hypothetical protein